MPGPRMRGPSLVLAVLLVGGCGEGPGERWEGFVHPYPSAPDLYEYAGTHDTLRGCQEMALAFLHLRGATDLGYFECGKDCGWVVEGDRRLKRCRAIARKDPHADLYYVLRDPGG